MAEHNDNIVQDNARNLSEKECPRVLSSVNYSIDVTFLEVFGNFLVVGQK